MNLTAKQTSVMQKAILAQIVMYNTQCELDGKPGKKLVVKGGKAIKAEDLAPGEVPDKTFD